ncbi:MULTISPECIES: alpha-ketoglutarate dehydrogenase [unclassified Pseudomonas]|uniref:alpha-ketoglutarate dehydrogenase n=1 Tax=unclassified Pseudomonas TaxID=196821 RepID=UPI0021C99F3C|nr:MULTISPECIES: alpha-ketoglutarate dehydrogenase [unclassified Pseudomonas]MCU1734228.1 alpha-ketoglutarate dehydrogenase [Pseudomonas sp. 20P_3.2_Bac4]MCU1743125.1 alpha-ketoglutarate dehydrogenase [Pseudomonas sp. 20P_3.2_Bac5]
MSSLNDNAVAGSIVSVDSDRNETQEWLESLEAVVREGGSERGQFLLKQLEQHARALGITSHVHPYSAYRNTIPIERQGAYPGDLAVEERITSIIRWNALAMVVRANQAYGDLGGHIASYASAAEIFEVGFNHFFRARDEKHGGDLVFYQPHSAPGVYARAFLEGRLSQEQLANYRQEVSGNGLSSYPHPWLMPDFWQFPTGSMGIGPISAVYQARYMRYLENRNLADTAERHVWGVFGDGEMDEPESIAGLTLAAREKLDNLTFIVNCNLQRLDGPVRGNGQVIQELEALFTGAGWNVIKVIWGSDWDPLFARDSNNALLQRFAQTVDGQYQTLGSKDGAYNLLHFFQQDPEIQALVSHMSDADIDALKRGGHDFRKLYAAFAAAKAHKGRPTVILAKTKKGYGMGGAGESRMTSHQAKKLDIDALKAFRDRFALPLSDDDVAQLRFYRPAEDSQEMRYLQSRRTALGGYMPARQKGDEPIAVPALADYARFAFEADGKEMSTTMAVVRMLGGLLKDKALGPRIVPIVADEARTFGMANLFRQIGIYSPQGQLYEPEDAGSMLYYREAKDGQLLEEGITEAGALSSWVAAATSYSAHGKPMLPFYIYYSMFGFQRVGDLIWAAADQRARGFLLGATAGRTTLGGEGLQHQDGSSHVVAATVPNCRAYDPAFAGELAVIVDHGMRQMMERGVDEFYYITVMNENYAQPSLPAGVEDQVIRGMYRCATTDAASSRGIVRLLGSGTILREVIAAAELLATDWQVSSEVWSVTSFSELAREARSVERHNRLNPAEPEQVSHLCASLAGNAPVVAATDYVRAWPQLIAGYVDARFVVLGTDGFGRSDTRAALRRFFEVDRHQVVLAALDGLVRDGTLPRQVLAEAVERYGLSDRPAPWTC